MSGNGSAINANAIGNNALNTSGWMQKTTGNLNPGSEPFGGAFSKAQNFVSNAWTGTPAKQIGLTENLTPQGRQYADQLPQQFQAYDFLNSPEFQQLKPFLDQFLKPYDQNQVSQAFQTGVADQAFKNYEQNYWPQIREQAFSPAGVNTGALLRSQAAGRENLSKDLASQQALYMQNAQQQYGNMGLNALMAKLGLKQAEWNQKQQLDQSYLGSQQGQPIVEEAQAGWLQKLIFGLVQALGGVARGGGLS